MSRVFISGSISIKRLPSGVIDSLKKIKDNNLTVLVGDADGVDKKIQDFYSHNCYDNVEVYSIYSSPRNISSSSFSTNTVTVDDDIKKERERQTKKDEAMTLDSEYSFIIWDGKSKGSHKNIIRALELGKKIKVYLLSENKFIEQVKVNKNEIDFIYYESNGYSAKEVVDYLLNEGNNFFKNTREFNKFLLDRKVIAKQDKVYVPLKNHNHFIIEKYKGIVTGIKFNNSFIDWLESEISSVTQEELF